MVFLLFIIFLIIGAGLWQMYTDYTKSMTQNSKHFKDQSSMRRKSL